MRFIYFLIAAFFLITSILGILWIFLHSYGTLSVLKATNPARLYVSPSIPPTKKSFLNADKANGSAQLTSVMELSLFYYAKK